MTVEAEVLVECIRNGGDFKRAVVHILIRRAVERVFYRILLVDLIRRRYDLPSRREEATP